MDGIVPVQRQLELGAQVMRTEYIEVGVQRLRCSLVPGQLQAHRRHFGGAEVVVTLGTAQAVAGNLLRLQAQHRKAIQIGALAEHLACFRPGGIQQDEQRTLALCRLYLCHHPLRLDELSGKHDVGLPLRLIQQRQQGVVYHRPLPAESRGVLDHISDQPAGIGGFERAKASHKGKHGVIIAKPQRACNTDVFLVQCVSVLERI